MQRPQNRLPERPQDIWLNQLQSATHYNQWTFSHIQPHLQGHTLEVGCGSGTFTTLIAPHCTQLLAVDLNPTYTQQTKARLKSYKHVKVITTDATTMECSASFDTIVMLDVLEHIENDIDILKKLKQYLTPNGKIILKVPAIETLYNSLDKAVGHHRRYTCQTLAETLSQASYSNFTFRYFNFVGIFGWWLNGVMDRSNPPSNQVGLFDRCVPIFRAAEAQLGCPIGLSLFAIASHSNKP
ncbi:MAG: methyltransferase [Cyanobacteria bacterium J06621_11]